MLFPFPDYAGVEPSAEALSLVGAEALCPAHLRSSGREVTLVTRYEDARAVLADDRFSRAAAVALTITARKPTSLPLNVVDPPVHTGRRRSISSALSARRIRDLQPGIEELAESLLDEVEAADGVVDLGPAFAWPLPVIVICRLLGLPESDRAVFHPWVEVMMSIAKHSEAEVGEAHHRMAAYFTGVLKAKQARLAAGGEPADMLEELLQPANPALALPFADLVVLGTGLLLAGYETSAHTLTACLYILIRHPEAADALRAEPDRVPRAVEEMMRWMSLNSTGGALHVATEDVELPGGTIPAGGVVLPLTDVANRDPAVFSCPADLDWARADNPHLSFGHGRHRCPGATLGRVEVEIGVRAFLRRFRRVELAVPVEELSWRDKTFIRGLAELPVRVKP
ncbi:cytochrome P450 [Actinosynnema sp. NPDC020468]|uniref:cytochrome P450 n=1 Tax=Actinosynnema sp. NPDC020468 TaxID=3154488 RepID=UPI00340229E4